MPHYLSLDYGVLHLSRGLTYFLESQEERTWCPSPAKKLNIGQCWPPPTRLFGFVIFWHICVYNFSLPRHSIMTTTNKPIFLERNKHIEIDCHLSGNIILPKLLPCHTFSFILTLPISPPSLIHYYDFNFYYPDLRCLIHPKFEGIVYNVLSFFSFFSLVV